MAKNVAELGIQSQWTVLIRTSAIKLYLSLYARRDIVGQRLVMLAQQNGTLLRQP